MKTAPKEAPPQFKVRPAQLREALSLAQMFETAVKLHFDYFSPEYAARVLRENSAPRMALSIVRPSRLIMLADVGGDIRGYAIGSMPSDGRAQLYWLYVEPSTRGHNLGRSLLSRILQVVQDRGASELQLITYRYTPYYARQGFTLVKKVHVGGVEQDIMRYEFK